LKPANLVHVAGFCISCGIVAYYLIPPTPREVILADTPAPVFRIPGLDDKDRIWGAALAYDEKGRAGNALGCFERYVTLYPDDPNAAKARERIAALRKAGAVPLAAESN
jgi:hypothetical protein